MTLDEAKAEGTLNLPSLDGVEISPGMFVIGEPTPVRDTNQLRALVNFLGALCVVELRMRFK